MGYKQQTVINKQSPANMKSALQILALFSVLFALTSATVEQEDGQGERGKRAFSRGAFGFGRGYDDSLEYGGLGGYTGGYYGRGYGGYGGSYSGGFGGYGGGYGG